MNELDEKLVTLIRTYGTLANPFTRQRIEEIKQAFIDAGWIDMRKLQKNWSEAEELLQGARPDDEAELMTGQEWYDRFEKEHKRLLKEKLEQRLAKEGRSVIGDFVMKDLADQAAKKAAGIE